MLLSSGVDKRCPGGSAHGLTKRAGESGTERGEQLGDGGDEDRAPEIPISDNLKNQHYRLGSNVSALRGDTRAISRGTGGCLENHRQAATNRDKLWCSLEKCRTGTGDPPCNADAQHRIKALSGTQTAESEPLPPQEVRDKARA